MEQPQSADGQKARCPAVQHIHHQEGLQYESATLAGTRLRRNRYWGAKRRCMTDKRVSRGSPSKQVADAVETRRRGQDEREEQQNSIWACRGGRGGEAASNEGEIEQMLHVGGKPVGAWCPLPILPSPEMTTERFWSALLPIQIFTLPHELRERKQERSDMEAIRKMKVLNYLICFIYLFGNMFFCFSFLQCRRAFKILAKNTVTQIVKTIYLSLFKLLV